MANLGTSFEAQANTTAVQDDAQPVVQEPEDSSSGTINTVATLPEKAAQDNFYHVKPKDLPPECWGIRMNEIHLPGSVIDFQAIKKEVTETNRRGVFLTKVHL